MEIWQLAETAWEKNSNAKIEMVHVASISERYAHNIIKTLANPGIWYSRGFLEANQGTPFTEHEADMDSNAEIETVIIF